MRKLNIEYNHSLDKAIDVLDVFSIAKPELTIEEIIKQTKLPKTTAYRILYTLERRGLINYDSTTSSYRLGLQFFRYYRVLSSSLDIVKLAEPILTDLQAKTGQTVLMSLKEGDNMVYVFKKESVGGLKYSSSVNERQPITYGIVGRIFMAYLPEEQYETFFSSPLPKWTPNTVVDKDNLVEQFKQIREEKLALETDETNMGVTGIGSPLFNAEGEVIAAVGVLGPTLLLTPEKIEEAKAFLLQSTEEISAKMGYPV